MQIVLLILKIIGIILLSVLGILLTLVLLLLFVPFCYRAEGSFYEGKPYVLARVRYLFPLLQVYVRYKEAESENAESKIKSEAEETKPDFMKNLEGKVKVLGFTVYDFFAEKKDSEEVPEKKNKPQQKTRSEKKQTQEESEASPQSEIQEMSEARQRLQGILSDESIAIIEERLAKEEKIPLSEKIRHFIEVLKEKVQAIIQKIKDIRQKGLDVKEQAEHIKEQAEYYLELWNQDYTQRAFQKAKHTLLKIWKSIRPRKGLAKVHFGTGDPGSTGQICGIFGMLYPFIGNYVMIEPEFEKKMTEGDFYLKGRISLYVFLKIVWIVLFDKDIKRLRKILMNPNKEDKYEQ